MVASSKSAAVAIVSRRRSVDGVRAAAKRILSDRRFALTLIAVTKSQKSQ
jgi:hypothetical protein